MSIKTDGFLAEESNHWRTVHEKRNKEWFGVARELNQLCQTMWSELPLGHTEDRWIFLARVLYLRGMTSFQAAVLLTSYGLTVDAAILARSLFEDIFCLGASRKDEKLVERLQKGTHAQAAVLRLLEPGQPKLAIRLPHVGQVGIARLASRNVRRRKAPSHIECLPAPIGHRAHDWRNPVRKDGGQRLEVSEVFVLPLPYGAREFTEGLAVSGDGVEVTHQVQPTCNQR